MKASWQYPLQCTVPSAAFIPSPKITSMFVCLLFVVSVHLCLGQPQAQQNKQSPFLSTTPKTTTTTTTTTTFTSTSKSDKNSRSGKQVVIEVELPATTEKPSGIEVTSYCNDPGRPSRSQISPVQLTYTDGETVVYTCDNYISLKQYRKCVNGKWQGDTPICGDAFRDNDLTTARYYDRDSRQLMNEYNVTGHLRPWEKFGQSFIAERYDTPLRGANASNYYIEMYMQRRSMMQMIRISFSVVNNLIDERLMGANFDVDRVTVSPYRDCQRVSNNSISPWHFNSTRFDYWFFCRSKSAADFNKELTQKSRLLVIETSANTPVEIDLATFILAEQYSNNKNLSDPICGLPEVPVGLESRVVNDQTNYVFTCARNFKRIDNFGGQFHVRTCGYDLRWHGQLPECHPTKTCSKFGSQSRATLVEVFKYDRIYYPKTGEWLPIPGSRAFFRCKDETHIFVGKEIRVCEEDGEWSGSMPNCLVSVASDPGLRANTILIIVLTTLIVTFILSSCTIYFFLKLRTQKPQNPIEMNEAAYYASSGIDPIAGKLMDDTYEVLEPFEARYASVNQYHPNTEPMLLKTSPYDDRNGSYQCIQDYNSGYPVPAPRTHLPPKQESEYYDDTVMDQPMQHELYQDHVSYQQTPYIHKSILY